MKRDFLIFAHRGAAHRYPENTFPAFKEALRLGASGLELDVQLTKDGYPVVIHDFRVNRTTNGRGLVKNYTLKEIKALSAGSWFHPRFAHLKIPTLEEVLIKAKELPILLNIELKNLLIKNENLESEVIRLVCKYGMEKQIYLSTFNPESISRIRHLNPNIQTSFLYFGILEEPWKMAYELGAACIQPPIISLTRDLVRASRERGLLVFPYHVNQWREIQRSLELGVDGVITMYPERVGKFCRIE
ncbi:glycerophosphodiester phosphodiesterase [Ammoniphilus resinae]|uniref:Glycerophosphoryl diester phosphodiesterase n=1 Tax=Ammoniphilus resinae TaxID=861532 RepID=A0ABS4GJY3_9BACL|nr:glycerophosphodiester phosphodiesterase [Ammoniphilus resinae]MBP1930575.1 glycerophosphoryl diester phosphodiesterase [Ammoniphilus resinae]